MNEFLCSVFVFQGKVGSNQLGFNISFKIIFKISFKIILKISFSKFSASNLYPGIKVAPTSASKVTNSTCVQPRLCKRNYYYLCNKSLMLLQRNWPHFRLAALALTFFIFVEDELLIMMMVKWWWWDGFPPDIRILDVRCNFSSLHLWLLQTSHQTSKLFDFFLLLFFKG